MRTPALARIKGRLAARRGHDHGRGGECVPGSSTLGQWIPAIPPIIPYAFVSLPFVLGFRLSCYYYRGAYYRAFWRAPAACAVREPHATYSGESKFPLIIQNLHRYFFYAAFVIAAL